MASAESYACIFCANHCAELKQLEKGKVPMVQECESQYFIKCARCHTVAGVDCAKLILQRIPENERKEDKWCQFISKHWAEMEKRSLIIPIGHCCELREDIPTKSSTVQKEKSVKQTTSQSSIKSSKSATKKRERRGK